ncbi:hypothetical protein D3C76_1383100 [compost metagenome]
MITFIYKTGFKNSVNGTAFKPPRKNSKAAKNDTKLCSNTGNEVDATCSYHSDDTCGVRNIDGTKRDVTVPLKEVKRLVDESR